MRGPQELDRPDAGDGRPYREQIEDAERRGEPVGAGRQVARGGPENADPDGATTDGEYGPGSD